MIEIILYSTLLSPIITCGLYTFFSGPVVTARHKAGK